MLSASFETRFGPVLFRNHQLCLFLPTPHSVNDEELNQRLLFWAPENVPLRSRRRQRVSAYHCRAAYLTRTRQGSDKREVDVHLLGDPKNEGTWIFQPPLDIGNGEASLRSAVLSIDMNFHGNG
jgi:hypothetical protein